MVYMQRYQIYLEPEAVKELDKFAKAIRSTRSRIIQDVVARVVRELRKTLRPMTVLSGGRHPIFSMCSLLKKAPGDLSSRKDERYLD